MITIISHSNFTVAASLALLARSHKTPLFCKYGSIMGSTQRLEESQSIFYRGVLVTLGTRAFRSFRTHEHSMNRFV